MIYSLDWYKSPRKDFYRKVCEKVYEWFDMMYGEESRDVLDIYISRIDICTVEVNGEDAESWMVALSKREEGENYDDVMGVNEVGFLWVTHHIKGEFFEDSIDELDRELFKNLDSESFRWLSNLICDTIATVKNAIIIESGRSIETISKF